ncbi:MAG: UDP-N-acetylmuramate dehydrogenase [Bacteroidales bacterium]|jgi:UDP-N-acetylmuramate dehydrogenase|nr:UDP-N-acetylmuramate dehydrogenase [Bacteroidales bacterium]
MEIYRNISLKPYNTFNIETKTAFFCIIDNPASITEAFDFALTKNIPFLILGAGSNILFTRNFDGLIAKVDFKGISIVEENKDNVWLEVKAGTDWEDLIDFSIDNHLSGLENLTLIPGKVGSAPIQNIGAYGVEVKDVLHAVTAFDLNTAQYKTFSREECDFGYRTSRFKEERGRYFITSVTLRLSKAFFPALSYEGLKKHIESRGIQTSLENIRNAVRDIRRQKLPEVGVIGSAGSFFKNPVLSPSDFEVLLRRMGEIPHFKSGNNIKVPAAWLIEQCGFKGIRRGDAGVWPGQPLVLVNYGNARGEEILSLAHEIMEAVKNKFGLALEPEVNII